MQQIPKSFFLFFALLMCGGYIFTFTLHDEISAEISEVPDEMNPSKEEDFQTLEIQTLERENKAFRLPGVKNQTWGFVLIESPISGLGDRFRAVVLGYHLAKLLNRSFKIDGLRMWKSEDEYLDTNVVNWRMTESEKLWMKSEDRTREIFMEINWKPPLEYDKIDFERLRDVEIIVIVTNIVRMNLVAANPILKTSPHYEDFNELHQKGVLYSQALSNLFKPGKRVLPHLEKIQREHWPTIDTFRIGVHLRSGDNPTLISNSRKRAHFDDDSMQCLVMTAISIWKEKMKSSEYKHVTFFVTADQIDYEEDFIQRIKSHGYKIFSNKNLGDARHISSKSADQLRTFVDWWTMVNLHTIIMSTNSGFSESASKFFCLPAYLSVRGGPCENRFRPFIEHGYCQKHFDQTFLSYARKTEMPDKT